MNNRNHFIGNDSARAISKAKELADDLARIGAGEGPTPADLADAPILDAWFLGAALQPVLYGSVVGHPRLGDSPHIQTTSVFAMDARSQWARTWSRWYRLGRSLNRTGRDQ